MTVKLIHGDCITEMQKLIDNDVKVDLVLTDVPYGTIRCKWDNVIPFDKMWDCIHNLINSHTPVLLFGMEPFSSYLRLSNIDEFKYDWIWNKIVGGSIFNRTHQPLNDYEIISVFYKKKGQYYPIMQKAETNRGFMKRTKSLSYLYGGVFDKNYEDNGLRFPKRIISLNSKKDECNHKNRVHTTQKPVKLLEYLIKTYTKENDTVLDFTMGSGSTGVACLQTNRNFIGIELDEKYYNIAKKRCSEYQSKLW